MSEATKKINKIFFFKHTTAQCNCTANNGRLSYNIYLIDSICQRLYTDVSNVLIDY